LSRKGSRNCFRVAVGSDILFSALRRKNDLEAWLFEWCSNGELDVCMSEYAVEEVEDVLDIGTPHLRQFLAKSGVEITEDAKLRGDAKYGEFAAEARQVVESDLRPEFIFAKKFLRENPKGFYVTGEQEILRLRERMDGRVSGLRAFFDELK